jgi:hypothetical protein
MRGGEMKKELSSITIEVLAEENGKLVNPIKIGEQEITDLGIYKCGELKIWVVKKLPKRISLPDHILPRHADHRENIVELCKVVNQIIAYIEQEESD